MIKFSEDQIVSMGLTPKATYGGAVASFTCAATGDYVWPIEALTDALSIVQRRASKIVAERNKKLRALFAAQGTSKSDVGA